MSKTVIITGASSGIGKACAARFQKEGYQVIDFSRRAKTEGGITGIPTDVTDEAGVIASVGQVVTLYGKIDALVCCAGFGISGAIECTKSSDAKAQMEVNLFGTDNCVRAVLPYMREQKSGHIVLISSVAGVIPIPFQAWYSMSKAAIISYAGALRNEVRPFKIKVCAVLPGDIKTGFTAARQKNEAGDDIYRGKIKKAVAQMEHDEQHGMSPDTVAEVVYQQATKRSPKPTVIVGFTYKLLGALIKFLPIRLSNWLVGKLY
ncbi:MAG: SDR family oxidoreductase [Lachnospiraceae bacterium]|nr:SDR family oxidoreductase [Lachnospiraceae bacterium]